MSKAERRLGPKAYEFVNNNFYRKLALEFIELLKGFSNNLESLDISH